MSYSKRTQNIEALLFFLNEEMGKKKVAELVGCSLSELEESCVEIREACEGRGIVLVETATTIHLGTASECSVLIESVTKAEELSPLSKAALETLSVVLYKAPISRAEIDTVRGVNSLYSVRNLMVRGLVARRSIEGVIVYEPTADALQFLGVSQQSGLPDYSDVLSKIDAITKGEEGRELQVEHNNNSEEAPEQQDNQQSDL